MRYFLVVALIVFAAGCGKNCDKEEISKEELIKRLHEAETKIQAHNARDAAELASVVAELKIVLAKNKELEVELAKLGATNDLRKGLLDLREAELKNLAKDLEARKASIEEERKKIEEEKAELKKAQKDFGKKKSQIERDAKIADKLTELHRLETLMRESRSIELQKLAGDRQKLYIEIVRLINSRQSLVCED